MTRERGDPRSWLRKAWDYVTKSRCPTCKASQGIVTHEVILESKDDYRTVSKRRSVRVGGKYGSSYEDVQVVMRFQVFDRFYRCKACDCVWSVRMERTFQP